MLKASGDVLLTAEAYNNRVIMEWLARRLRDKMVSGGWQDERLPVATRAMCRIWNYVMSVSHRDFISQGLLRLANMSMFCENILLT